jgi:3-hydroxyacyl-CoA dehydrogenase/enoyl-CoA hydratase/3-hydroxybutyryl-CoA epimerase/enoyl-CoA isomerase
VELDIALIYGLGFPPFRGGPFRYADAIGLKALCEKAGKFASLGKLYEPTAQMLQLAEAGGTFHETGKPKEPSAQPLQLAGVGGTLQETR